jgi:hypothetical protein
MEKADVPVLIGTDTYTKDFCTLWFGVLDRFGVEEKRTVVLIFEVVPYASLLDVGHLAVDDRARSHPGLQRFLHPCTIEYLVELRRDRSVRHLDARNLFSSVVWSDERRDTSSAALE